jgi:hypothetical protein
MTRPAPQKVPSGTLLKHCFTSKAQAAEACDPNRGRTIGSIEALEHQN